MSSNFLSSFKIPKKEPNGNFAVGALSPSRVRVDYAKNGTEGNEIEQQPDITETRRQKQPKTKLNGNASGSTIRTPRGRKRKDAADKEAEDSEVSVMTTRKGRRKSAVPQVEVARDETEEPSSKRTRTQIKSDPIRQGSTETVDISAATAEVAEDPIPEQSDGSKGKRGRKQRVERGKQPVPVTGAEPLKSRGRGKSKKPENHLTAKETTNTSTDGSSCAAHKEQDKVVCGACEQTFDNSQLFRQHALSVHYGLARPKGESQEFNKTEEMRALKEAVSKFKKLVCGKCDKRYTTAGGYAYHIKLCGKTKEELEQRVKECPVCSAKVIFLDLHMKNHEKPSVPPGRTTNSEEPKAEENSSSSKARRASAIKAGSLISQVAADVDGSDEKRNHYRAKWHFIAPGASKVSNSITGAWKREIGSKGAATCRHPGCKFTSPDLDKMKDHHVNCPVGSASKYFSCLRCTFHSASKSQMVDHVTKNHVRDNDKEVDFKGGDEEEDDDDDDDADAAFSDEEKSKKGGLGRAFLDPNTPSLIFRKPEVIPRFPQLLAAFHRDNYSWDRPLYADWLPTKTALSGSGEFLPANDKESDPFAFVPEAKIQNYSSLYKGDVEWKRLRRFQSHTSEDSALFFCGDAVSACAWCPMPNVNQGSLTEDRDQYLAVATLSQSQNKTSALEARLGDSGSIQLWNCGMLLCHSQDSPPASPKLAAVIVHRLGRVWNLEWCPSGTFNEDVQRLGLLAAACGNGTVEILTVPFPPQSDDLAVLEADVCATLRLPVAEISECTALNWDTTKDHRFILAGFANGTVALWDVGTASPVLRQKTGEIVDILPVWTTRGHHTAVTGVSLSPHHGGGRVFATVSIDRTLKMWDRYDSDVPVCVLRKQRLTGVKWKKHWPCVAVAQDDCYALTRCRTFLYDFECSGQKQGILGHNSCVLDVTENEYLDALAHCTAAGEVMVVDGFVPFIESDEFSRARNILLRTDLVNLDNDRKEVVSRVRPEYRTNQAPESAESVRGTRILFTDTQDSPVINQYGILIHHYRDSAKLKKPKRRRGSGITSEKMDVYRPCDPPVASINKVAFNPNLQSHIWLSVCRENGMVQLIPVRGLLRRDLRDNYMAEFS